jgi:hypothetical protein
MWLIRNAELGSKLAAGYISQGFEPFAVTHLSWAMNPMIYFRKKAGTDD